MSKERLYIFDTTLRDGAIEEIAIDYAFALKISEKI